MAKRLTEQQKKEIIKLFLSGMNVDQISKKFNYTKLTISRNLKNNLDELTYKKLLAESKINNQLTKNNIQKTNYSNKSQRKVNQKTLNRDLKKIINKDTEVEFVEMSEFVEIAPLQNDIIKNSQKDLSSIPISEVDLPKTVFMIVDKKVELEIKNLKDYPEWQFLSEEELKRKTIEIYYDIKLAKGFCGKEQKVIKVPNSSVLIKVAPILRSRGISRIVSSDRLISL